MQPYSLVAVAANPTVEIFSRIESGHLDAPTPCSEYDVRGLLNHLLFWGPSLAAAARKEMLPPPAEKESEVQLAGPDWSDRVEAQTELIVEAWSTPAAWEGSTRMGGPMELPAAMVGGMVVCELVVHAWDLGTAIGQRPNPTAEVLAYTHEVVVNSAELGREMGVYGPAVPVPDGAPLLDRILGLTGRDPAWQPNAGA